MNCRITRLNFKCVNLVVVSLLLIFAVGSVWATGPANPVSRPDVTVYKTAYCSCCTKWTDQLEQSGLNVNVIIVKETKSVRSRLGVPQELGSCHTAGVGDYWVEGHVPADLLHKLMNEKPSGIKGLAVPGMVPGSPGMEAPNPSDYRIR